jgi:tetrahydromethanopterin S-methyltransferase subunit E
MEHDQWSLSIVGIGLGAINFFHEKVELMMVDISMAWPWIDTVAKLLGIVAVIAVIYMNVQVAWKARAERRKILRTFKNRNKNEDA